MKPVPEEDLAEQKPASPSFVSGIVTPVAADKRSRGDFLAKLLMPACKPFGMNEAEAVRFNSAGIRTVGEFLAMNSTTIREMYKKKPFLAHHLIAVQRKAQAEVDKLN